MNIQKKWGPGEWEHRREKLEQLSLDQLRFIADRVGIRFAGGNDAIQNKEEFLAVLDESDPHELKGAYEESLRANLLKTTK